MEAVPVIMCCSNAGWTNRAVDKRVEGRTEINVRRYTKEGKRVSEIQGNGLERLGLWVARVCNCDLWESVVVLAGYGRILTVYVCL